jgi:mono/diheme cytochrome c family protein
VFLSKVNMMQFFALALVLNFLFFTDFPAWSDDTVNLQQAGDSSRGKIVFQQNCAICHTTSLGAGSLMNQNPSIYSSKNMDDFWEKLRHWNESK